MRTCGHTQSSGGIKYSISICSNSRDRNTKLRGVISLRKAFPICAIPKGTCVRITTVRLLRGCILFAVEKLWCRFRYLHSSGLLYSLEICKYTLYGNSDNSENTSCQEFTKTTEQQTTTGLTCAVSGRR
jgi:hypothetical protein